MNNRITANTQSLQRHFAGHYRDFFANCQRVASASNSFLWGGEFSGFYGGLTLGQKLPLRSYVGLETTSDGTVVVDTHYIAYEPNEQHFVHQALDSQLQQTLRAYLEKTYSHSENFTGVKVHILTEIPLGHSLGSNGAIAAALALLVSEQDDFDSVYKVAREILAFSQAGHSSGFTAYAALAETNLPIIFHSKETEHSAIHLETLLPEATNPAWPIDFGLFYTGTQANAESVILANNHSVDELNKATKNLENLLNGHIKLQFQETYIDMLNMTTGLMINHFVELFTKGTSKTRLENFFSTLNQYQNLLHILDISTNTVDYMYSYIHQVANKQKNEVGSGVKISGIGKGGALLFALPYGNHRTGIGAMIDSMREATHASICLDYASWLDGIGGEPGVIEQDINKGQYSTFIEHDTYALTVLDQGTLISHVLTKERFNQYAPTIDLLLDSTTGKIFVAGQPVTSKELPSQKSTVTILADLIKSADLSLKNTDLPGTYGANRYDLQGKIVMPLIKQIKDITNRDLQLSVQGSMYEDFTLSLKPSNIVIGVVENKF